MMPTLSFKDRGATTLVSHMKAIGVKKCVQDSSGNAGVAGAAYCARSGIACEIYVPEGTSPNKIAMIEGFGAKAVVVPGTRDHCAEVCRSKVKEEGAYYATTFTTLTSTKAQKPIFMKPSSSSKESLVISSLNSATERSSLAPSSL